MVTILLPNGDKKSPLALNMQGGVYSGAPAASRAIGTIKRARITRIKKKLKNGNFFFPFFNNKYVKRTNQY